MLNFDFIEKDLRIVSPSNSLHDFPRKIFFMLHSINRPSFIVWLPLRREILGNMGIHCNCFLTRLCDVTNIEINVIFQIKLVFLRQQKVKTKV